MKFVALLSGGKDSCFNIVHCQQNGHELIAAASLCPGEGKDEIDSYMYQTVGQDAIHFVAQALEVPLHRRIITGQAVEQGADYGPRAGNADVPAAQGVAGDETEDLFELLSLVKREHPDVQGVSAGAILSNYQRVRIEQVCRRLSLTPLAFLWQRDQTELLQEMIESGLDAVLIKVAGIGLTAKHLGKSLSQMQPTLLSLHRLYGAHVCGEGGEYETLTLDCPAFKSRIILTDVEQVIHSDHDFAPVAFLRIKSAALERKPGPSNVRVPRPALLDSDGRNLAESPVPPSVSMSPMMALPIRRSTAVDDTMFGATSAETGLWVAIGNMQRSTDIQSLSTSLPIDAEIHQCFTAMKEQLARHVLTLADISHIDVFLSSMELFPPLNAVYASIFGSSPPTRACVAVPLPSPLRVRMHCLACRGKGRAALHVQGLSYWAPANIGPYSQAITVDETVTISGQIGLIPASMTMPEPQSLALEAALSFQHVDRIVQLLRTSAGGGWSGRMLLALCWTSGVEHLKNAATLWRRSMDLKGSTYPPVLFAAASELPRGALIEAQVVFHTGRPRDGLDNDETEGSEAELIWEIQSGRQESGQSVVEWQVLQAVNGTSAAVVLVKHPDQNSPPVLNPEILHVLGRSLSVRIFYLHADNASRYVNILAEGAARPAVTTVPVRGLTNLQGEERDVALMCLL